MDQQVKQWLDYAAQDLGVARHLFENYHPKPLEIVATTASSLLKKRSRL